jgi:hypothetical protein
VSKRFLIGQLACFGDCLYATTIAKQIKIDYPDSHITWAVAEKYKSIIELNPHVDELWVVKVSNNDYYGDGWNTFYNEAIRRQNEGRFDEVVFSQIEPLNWSKFDGTIRRCILSSYKNPITTSVEPVVRLSEKSVEQVRIFADKNNLSKYRNVVLFECLPGSGQSKVDVDFAMAISVSIAEKNPGTCFVLSSAKKLPYTNDQIIDASELTYIENAELTKYCTHLVGCSSGITWLSTSDWAKKLPMLQLLDPSLPYFAGINFDFQLFGIDNSRVIEMISFDRLTVEDCIQAMIDHSAQEVKGRFNQSFKPSAKNLNFTIHLLVQRGCSLVGLLTYGFRFYKLNRRVKNEFVPNLYNILEDVIKAKFSTSFNLIFSKWAKFSRNFATHSTNRLENNSRK